ncbi:MAG: GntR family transcriptional regulator [Deltaproteobacteria bacterium]|jgi:DNA-binding GntR family transcriptional regulator|nr:GntR family transcriptional regulator [Deltaproteobacteria bacterium]
MLNTTSLREQIYSFLKEEMRIGNLTDEKYINTTSISNQLGISKTPLRDALIQLEAEGFVTILPRRGIFVNKITLKDIKESYEIIGSLEATVISSIFDQLTPKHIKILEQLNQDQLDAIKDKDFDQYYQLNLDFHNVFLDLSDNEALKKTITPLKQRLYDFPRRNYVKKWEAQHLEEHQEFINAISQNDSIRAADIMKTKHWSFEVHKKYFSRFYEFVK